MKRQIKKQDLNNYVDKLVNSRVVQEREKSSTYWTQEAKPVIVEAYMDFYGKALERMHRDLKNELTDLADVLPMLCTHDYHIQQLNFYLNKTTDIKGKSADALLYYLKDRTQRGECLEDFLAEAFGDLGNAEGVLFNQLNDLLDEYRKIWKRSREREEQLYTLNKEAKRVIRNSKSGKEGHKNLIALGFPMEDFVLVDDKPQLPAVQKFSVDVCVLRDDCKESLQK